MMFYRFIFGSVLCSLLSLSAAASTATKVEIVSHGGKYADIGDVFVTWDDGKHQALTHRAHAEQPKLGPDGLIGWTWSKKRYRKIWVDEHMRVQRGKRLLFEVTSGKPFIESWDFIAEGVAVKSRAMHGPALIELFSLKDGKRIEVVKKAYGEGLPAWAKPYSDD
jgi:hypothetical protein